MYRQFESGDTITFCCNGKLEKSGENKKLASEDTSDFTHGDHKQKIKKIALELTDMHGEKYNNQFRQLRAQMTATNSTITWIILLIFPLLLVE